MVLLYGIDARKKTSIFMQMLIEACSAPSSRIVDLTIETCINFYILVFSKKNNTPQISLQFFSRHISYIIHHFSSIVF